MRKELLILLVMFIVIGQSLLFAANPDIEGFLQSYEALVAETETLSARATINAMDLMHLQQRALDFSQRALVVQEDPSFSIQDSLKLLELTNRYTTAMNDITIRIQNIAPAAPVVPAVPGLPSIPEIPSIPGLW